jgi:PKD repeat protein
MKKYLFLFLVLLSLEGFSQGYQLNYVNGLINYHGFTGRYGSPPLWEDSTVVLTSGTGSTSFSWWIHGIGSIFDPTSAIWDSLTGTSGVFSDTNAFIIDSVSVYYWYSRPVTSVVDTLRITLIPRTGMNGGVYQFNEWPGPGDTVRNVLLVDYDYTSNRITGTGLTTIDYLLDNDDTSTVALGRINVPVNDTLWETFIMGANTYGIGIQYLSGQTWNSGDTLVEQSGLWTVWNPLNAVQIPTYEEFIGAYPATPFQTPSFNEGMILPRESRYNISTGWNGRWVPAYAYVPGFLYEHPSIDWWVRPMGANFNWVASGTTVDFTDLSTHLPDKWHWDFGDGDTSNVQHPTHTYATSTTYNVCLTATNTGTGETHSVCRDVPLACLTSVTMNVPQSKFCDSANVTLTSTGTAISNYKWYDGVNLISTDSFVNLNYSGPGNHTIILIVDNGTACSDTAITTINVSGQADASFTSTNVSFVHSFFPINGDGISWLWDFGDGGTDTVENPVHGYLQVGNYDVCLIMENACGFDTVCNSIFSSVDPIDISDRIAIYPNPSGSVIQVDLDHPNINKANVRIRNMLGQPVQLKHMYTSSGFRFDIRHLAAGLYSLEVEVEGSIGVQKVLVQR